MSHKNIKVVIADDHPLVLRGVRRVLKSGSCIDVVGSAGNGLELFTLLESRQCDAILIDYSMPHEKAPTEWLLIAVLSNMYPALPIVVFSEFDDPFLIGSLVLKGVEGVVSKRDDVDEIEKAILQVANGGRYLSPLAGGAFDIFGATPAFTRFAALTKREIEVIGLMLCGLSVGEIARLLRRSVNTISAQRSGACRRLGFDAQSSVYRFAANHGLSLGRSVPDSLDD